MFAKFYYFLIMVTLFTLQGGPLRQNPSQAAPAASTYYISSSTGNDANNGLSPSAPFATVSKVNSLALAPGDQVLFKCGDAWRAEPLIITRSGSAGQTITFGSYPGGCTDQPLLSGSQPIAGWTQHSGAIYVADLDAGDNAGEFHYGVNQLFRDGVRLTMGRWPNLDAGDGGYSTIDAQPAAAQIRDNQLPPGDWSGAIAHIRGMRWYILNRQVSSSSGGTLTLGAAPDCWSGDCTGWGYFLNNHLNTLDRDGEWHYDAAAGKVYLYSASGAPGDGQVEGSVVLRDDDRAWGGIILGEDLGDEISQILVENLVVRNWYRHGITTPTNLRNFENSYITLQNNLVADVDSVGINLATWVYDAQDGPSGWRGGDHITVSGNTIQGANRRGIDSYAKNSTITSNSIRDIGLIPNLNAAGMGCGLDASGGACTEDGDGIRIKIDKADESGHSNTVSRNRLERIAYNGIDVFGHSNIFQNNFIQQACYVKGDCGGMRTFGRDSLNSSNVYDLTIQGNIIVDTPGNTDGCHENYDPLFGFGLYIDNYSRSVTITGNTVISSTAAGILYQRSTGSIQNNTLYSNGISSMYAGQIRLSDSPVSISTMSGNILYALDQSAWTLSAANKGVLASSDDNAFFHPYVTKHINSEGNKTLAEWQSYSGMDATSWEAWFSLSAGEAPRSRIYYNATSNTQTVDLGAGLYQDLEQAAVSGSISLPPFSSQILIYSGEAADLVLTMQNSGGPDVLPGAPLTYTLQVSNQGSLTAAQVVLTHNLPVEVVDTTWQASDGLSGASAQSGTRYILNLPDMAPGASGVITVTGKIAPGVEAGATLLLTASVSTVDVEVSTANNSASLLLGQWFGLYLPLIVR